MAGTYATIEVKIHCDGPDFTNKQICAALKRIAKAARGKSKTRHAQASCEDFFAESKGELCN